MHGTRERDRGEEVYTTHGKESLSSLVSERPESSGPSFAQATCSGSCNPEPKKHVSGVSLSTLFTSTMRVHCEGLVGRELLMLLCIGACCWRMLRCVLLAYVGMRVAGACCGALPHVPLSSSIHKMRANC